VIQATSSAVRVSHHVYPELTLIDVVDGLLARDDLRRHETLPRVLPDPRPAAHGPGLTISDIFEELNDFLRPHHLVIADVGDTLFGAVELRAGLFIGAGYYASMGLAVPGAIGAQMAAPAHRPVVLVGDGAFKMNGVEIATAVDLGLNPIVILINNGTFATLRVLDPGRDYVKVRPWDYVGLARSLGATGERVTTRADFVTALGRAEATAGVYLIDAVTGEDDASLALRRLAAEFGPRIQRLIAGSAG
jgi:indolepyruvate decarboxylase